MEPWVLVVIGAGAGGAIGVLTSGIAKFVDQRLELAREARSSSRANQTELVRSEHDTLVGLRRRIEDYLQFLRELQLRYLEGAEGAAEPILTEAKLMRRLEDRVLRRAIDDVTAVTTAMLQHDPAAECFVRERNFRETSVTLIPTLTSVFRRMDDPCWPDQ